MNCTLEEYIADAKSQLCCNYPYPGYGTDYISYDYTEEQVDRNISYFEQCLKKGLSAYKALLFFPDYIDNPNISYGQYEIVTKPEQKYY